MVIILTRLRRVGNILDSSKMAILANKISGSLSKRTKGKYIARATIEGLKMKINVLTLNPETGKYSQTLKNEQEIMAGRISNFLNSAGVSHDIVVR